ncbi:MAG: 4-hydroxythreonine-4-phosphate dehydrogenase PdxA [Prevotella sp.]|nr:4-hydroxythreonine-4-phosphate dehydrogenase PdxA [Prevotella sp.]MBQ8715934.1 4-hydroxythreonine-4-phosphate dehydrogenase PdxA [Prevotella sp.]
MEEKMIRVAITQGDTNGVGYEVILKTFSDPAMFELCTPIIYGSPKIAAYHRKALNLDTNFSIINSAEEARDGRLNILTCFDEDVKVELGQPSEEAGQAAYKALDRAMTDYRAGLFDVLVTAPINKATIQSPGFHFPGHTEYIETSVGDGNKALMILMNESLRVALVTTHLPIKDIAKAITKEAIIEKATIFHKSLKRDFRISNPRIAVLSLNPHAGDNGLLGSEEQEVIKPAIDELEKQGIQAFGPYPADGFFGSNAYDHFDGVLAMYHDQGLAPFKTIALESGVNFTAGLPIVRTSPDHGTAFDIAGQGKADENSFRQAVYTAIDVFRNRQDYDEPLQNPLPKLFHEKRDDSEKVRFAIPKAKDQFRKDDAKPKEEQADKAES